MLNIIKEKLDLSPDLKKKIDWAKKYTSTPIKLEKGHLIRLEPSNLAYVDPHKVKINNYTFLFFNGVNTFYVLLPITDVILFASSLSHRQ